MAEIRGGKFDRSSVPFREKSRAGPRRIIGVNFRIRISRQPGGEESEKNRKPEEWGAPRKSGSSSERSHLKRNPRNDARGMTPSGMETTRKRHVENAECGGE